MAKAFLCTLSLTEAELARFEAKIDRPADGCWLWKASKMHGGYGAFRLRGATIKAHRVSWILNRGDIPEGLLVCHHCDTPACVRPGHLFLGTDKSNAVDRNMKGRTVRGAASPAAKITEAQALAIRKTPGRHADIAAWFGVSKSLVRGIKAREFWAHLP